MKALSQDTELLCGDLCGFLENLKVILNSYRHLVHLIEIYINTNNETQSRGAFAEAPIWRPKALMLS